MPTGLAEVAVAGLPDAEWGEVVTAWVVPAGGAGGGWLLQHFGRGALGGRGLGCLGGALQARLQCRHDAQSALPQCRCALDIRLAQAVLSKDLSLDCLDEVRIARGELRRHAQDPERLACCGSRTLSIDQVQVDHPAKDVVAASACPAGMIARVVKGGGADQGRARW